MNTIIVDIECRKRKKEIFNQFVYQEILYFHQLVLKYNQKNNLFAK